MPEEVWDSSVPLAIALAAERKKGDQSEFWPHLRLLPAEPQALWLKTPAEQSAIYDDLGDLIRALPSILLYFLTALATFPCMLDVLYI